METVEKSRSESPSDLEKSAASQVSLTLEPDFPESPTEPEETITYPEGGLSSWLTVFGAWSAMVGGLGLVNTISPLQAYISRHQLAQYPQGTVSWIFSTQLFILFFLGIFVGPLFDACGPRWLTLAGTICLFTAMMLLGECTEYWHFILVFSVLSGLGGSLLLTPPIAAVGHFFDRRRGFATGIAMTGPSSGGIIFPLVFRATYPKLGFAWATRILGFIMLFLCVLANIFLRSRLPRKKVTFRRVLPDFKIFLDGDGCLALCTAGLFLMELALFIPLGYLTSYCVAKGIERNFSYQVIAILNAASVLGRTIPGFLSDKAGRYNVMIFTLLLCAIVTLCVWLPASILPANQTALAVVFSVLFGLASGSNLGLVGPCIGQLCETKDYGRYFATSYMFVSFATLIGIPIAGSLIESAGGAYWSMIVFCGVIYVAATICMAAVRIIKVGCELRAVF